MSYALSYTKLPLDLLNPVWDVYEKAMRPLRKKALQKHVLEFDQFVHLMTDERAVKFLGLNEVGTISGLGTRVGTDELPVWPYIEPEYLEENWPAEYKDKRIWYVPFIVTTQQDSDLFPMFLERISEPVRRTAGMAFMDFCEYNDQELHIPQTAATIAGRRDWRLRARKVDSQGYWIFTYAESESPVGSIDTGD